MTRPGARFGPWDVGAAAAGVGLGVLLLASWQPGSPGPDRPAGEKATGPRPTAETDPGGAPRAGALPPRFVTTPPVRLSPRPARSDLDTATAAARDTLTRHDPRAWEQLPRQLEKEIMGQQAEIQKCGQAYLARTGRPGLAFAARVSIVGRIEGDQMRPSQLLLPDGDEKDLGDPTFQACLERVVVSRSLSCRECRNGEVVFPWPLQIWFPDQAPHPPAQPAGTAAAGGG